MTFSTSTIDAPLELNKENLERVIDHLSIYKYYISEPVDIGRFICSPLRDDDGDPSFKLFITSGGRINFIDFGGHRGDVYQFVGLKCGYRMPEQFFEVLKRINSDMSLGLDCGDYVAKGEKRKATPNQKFTPTKMEKVVLQIKPKAFVDIDLEFWGQIGATVDDLRIFNVYAVDKLFRNGIEQLQWAWKPNSPTYAYHFPRTDHLKIYRPLEKGFDKWRSSASNELDIQGYDQLPPKGNLIIHTKSMKDIICLRKLGYYADGTHGEAHKINPDYFRHIGGRFTTQVVFYDNDYDKSDNVGRIQGQKLSQQYGFKQIEIPDRYKCKDVAEFRSKFGEESSKQLLEELLNG